MANLYSVWNGGKQVGATRSTAAEALAAYRDSPVGTAKPATIAPSVDEDRLRRIKIRMLPDAF